MKETLKKNFYYVINSGTVLALSGAAIIYTGALLLERQPPLEIITAMFLLVMSSYNINRFTDNTQEDKINHQQRSDFYFKNKDKILALTVLGIVTAYYLTFLRAGIEGIVILSLFPIGVVMYSIKWLPFKKIKRLKEIIVFKDVWVAIIWATVGTGLLEVSLATQNFSALIVIFLFIFIRLIVGTIVFDMRDIAGDLAFGIKTIPVVLGEKLTKTILQVINYTSAIVIIIAVLTKALPLIALPLVLVSIYGHFFLNKMLEKGANIHIICDLIVDGEYIVWGVLVFIATMVQNLL